MKHCEMVKDLMPLVAEHMASEESTAFVKEHLETCETCRAAFDAMQTPVETETAAPLKTVRKRVKKRGWLIAGFAACLVVALVVAGYARLKKAIPLHTSEEAFSAVEVIRVLKDVENKPGEDLVLEQTETDSDKLQVFWSVHSERTADGQVFVGALADDNISGSEDDKEYPFVVFAIKTVAEQIADENNQSVSVTMELVDAENEELLIPKTVELCANPITEDIQIESVGGERFVTAYTSLWHQWLRSGQKTLSATVQLADVDAVYFEPYNNADHEILYQRDGYEPESGFALPRLVMNYYFLIALAATAVLFIPWLVLLLTKKQKARRVFDVLLLIAGSGTLAFLTAGFPVTSIAPLRELIFVCIIAVLLFGAGLCGRKLFRKE